MLRARTRTPLARTTGVAIVVVALGCAVWASQALAVFPFVGKGTLSEPSSWKLAPGETVTNLGGELTQHFGSVPQTPAGEPVEAEEIKKLNGQEDELCGVMGMSITDAHATMPAGTGSCIAPGTAIHTGFQASLGRPDVSLAELDSGVEWNDPGAMLQVRAKYLLNVGELPGAQSRHDQNVRLLDGRELRNGARGHGRRLQPRRGNAGRQTGRLWADPLRRARTGGLQRARLRLRLARCESRADLPAVHEPPDDQRMPQRPRRHAQPRGPDHRLLGRHRSRPQRLCRTTSPAGTSSTTTTTPTTTFSTAHGTGELQDSAAEANTGRQRSGTCPNCVIMPLRVGSRSSPTPTASPRPPCMPPTAAPT